MYVDTLIPGQIFALYESRARREIRTMVNLISTTELGEWLVEDLRTSRKELVGTEYLGWHQVNEMEVLAWASK